jgi:hypothetical protein
LRPSAKQRCLQLNCSSKIYKGEKMMHWTSAKFQTFSLQKTLLKRMKKDKLQNGIKYSQTTNPTKSLYQGYLKNSQTSTLKTKYPIRKLPRGMKIY